MSIESKMRKCAMLFAVSICAAAWALSAPAAAQPFNASIQASLPSIAPGADRSDSPAPFFPTPIELFPPSNSVPGPEAVYLSGVSCARPGNCAAVGQYIDTTGSSQPMIITQTNGVWDQAFEANLPADSATAPGGQIAFLFGVYCTSVGNCVAAGAYTDSNGNEQPLVVTETDGVWATGIALSLPANATSTPGTQFAFLNIVRCPSPGNCAITGGYSTNGGSLDYGALVFSQRKGVWGRGVQIALPANATTATSGPTNPAAGLNTMGALSCLRAGNCVGGGQYTDTNFNSQPMISTEMNGAWSQAIELTLPDNAATAESSQNGFLANIVCFAARNCSVGGGYNDINGNAQPAVFNETRGVWAKGFELSLPANAATAPGTQSAYLNGFNCTSRGNCFAYSAYNDLTGSGQPLVITETGGLWAQGVEPPLPDNAITTAGDQDANIYDASCTSPGFCAAVGNYVDTDGNLQAMVYSTVPMLSIATLRLPSARVRSTYRARLLADGGAGQNEWSVSAGVLPGGLTLDASTGKILGAPSATGIFNFTVSVTDSGTTPSQQASGQFSILVRK